jgi:glycosyltransferase involved in cell wall biosynthesis
MQDRGMTILDVVCPVYREEEVIASFHASLAQTLDALPDNYTVHITYVVDPSPDGTENVLASIAQADPRVEILTMSRRFGHQMALVAGIDHSDGDIIVMLDSDLQHPPELIPELLRHWEDGSEIVQTIRKDGAEANWLKRSTSRWFYATFMKVGAVNLQSGAADYRLISRRVAQVFRKEIREHNQFLRGLMSWVGFRVTFVPFTPTARKQGKSKYQPATLINFALNGICSFSKVPLRFCIGAGLILATLSMLGAFVEVLMYAIGNVEVRGWTSLIAMVSFVGGIQLFFLGVLGEYISLIFDEVKDRPLYLLDRRHRRGIGSKRDDSEYDPTLIESGLPSTDLTYSNDARLT